MGILNLTPDSFFEGSRISTFEDTLRKAENMLHAGATMLDIGGVSTRPGADEVPEEEELRRVVEPVRILNRAFPEAIISIDTWRGRVAREAIAAGAGLVNDISAGQFDPTLWPTVAEQGVPYILMHIQGTPATMQIDPKYTDIVAEVLDFFIQKVKQLRDLGVRDIVIDPGFGFGKTVEHNYELLKNLPVFAQILELPVLVGVSRKSMICKVLKVNPDKALNGTTALHMVALQQGAKILRVHDVREAIEVIRIWEALYHPIEGHEFFI